MKKSMIRIATIALAVVMLSTCAITSIVAGYQTAASTAEVVATVSGFGITVTTAQAADANLTLVPGGSGNLITVTANSTNGPSVDAALAITAAAVTYSVDMPILITIDGTPVTRDAESTLEAYQTKVANAIKAVTESYAAGVAVNNVVELTIGWSWDAAAVGTNNVPENATITVSATAQISQVEVQ